MIVTFDETTHTYELDGKSVPGVTSILKDVLGAHPAAIGAGEYHLKRGQAAHALYAIAGKIAKTVHDIDGIRRVIETQWNIDQALVPYMDQWLAWYAAFGGQVIDCEIVCASRIFGYAGTADLIVDGVLIDFKQSQAGRDAYQMAAYAMACKEMHGIQIDGLMSVQITANHYKAGKIIKGAELKRAISAWHSILSVYRMKERGE